MSAEVPHDLAELARRLGVEPGYFHVKGHWVSAQRDALLAIVRSLGYPIDHPGQARDALDAQDAATWAALAPPVAIGFGAGPARLSLRMAASHVGPIAVEITLEDGTARSVSCRVDELPVTFGADVGGIPRVERCLDLVGLAEGYHRALVETGGQRGETLVIQAPERAHRPPGSMCGFGLFAPVYALGGERGVGCGDLSDFRRLADQTRALGGAVVGTLPLLAGFYGARFEPSPYSPVSRLFWNELYLDSRALAAELGVAYVPATGADRGRTVDFSAAYDEQRRALSAIAAVAWQRGGVRAALEAELERRPRLADYARFRAAVERFGAPWASWPAAARDGALDPACLDDDVARFHVFVQWALGRQLAAFKTEADAGRSAGLYLDLPVGSHPDGYDQWRERSVFAPGMTVGAPPDPLAWDGQNWALPPLAPQALRRTGHRYFIDCVRAHAEHASLLRVDHVMGLHRLFWIPSGMPASQGVYVRYPADELWAVVSLESRRNACAIAGEDLGTVPEEVRPTMERRGIHRLFVAQFDWTRGSDRAWPNVAPAGCVASLDTHDTQTFAAFSDAAELGDAGELLVRWLSALGESEADLVLVALEDLWLEREPQNVPGTTDETRANWRQRLARHLPDGLREPLAQRALASLLTARKNASQRSGRPVD